jgi:TolB protein
MAAFAPSPSPDGSEVAFAGVAKGAGPLGNVELYILRRDGRARPISPSRAYDGDPAWSPDGTRLAFISSRANGALDVFVVELASGAITRLTDADYLGGPAGSGFAARSPAWSPDGASIAYTVQGTTGSPLWIMGADGRDKRQLTAGDVADDFDPQCHPTAPSSPSPACSASRDPQWS